jgi:hypothetical protein
MTAFPGPPGKVIYSRITALMANARIYMHIA